MFDPEKARRFDWNTGDPKVNGEHVLASDYDQLLELYRKERQSAESYANALQYGE